MDKTGYSYLTVTRKRSFVWFSRAPASKSAMAEACTWIVFKAHPHRIAKKDKEHPDYHGVFICPASRREPEQLLGEVLSNHKLFLSDIVDHRAAKPGDDWGMYERLKSQVDEQGFGLSLTKLQHGMKPQD